MGKGQKRGGTKTQKPKSAPTKQPKQAPGVGNQGMLDMLGLGGKKSGNDGGGGLLKKGKKLIDDHYFGMGEGQHCLGMPIGKNAKVGACTDMGTLKGLGKGLLGKDDDSPKFGGLGFKMEF